MESNYHVFDVARAFPETLLAGPVRGYLELVPSRSLALATQTFERYLADPLMFEIPVEVVNVELTPSSRR